MAHFDLVHDVSGNPELEKLYRDLVEQGFAREGRPTNWFTSQAIRPDILAVTWPALRGILLEGKLPPSLKQMIALVLSAQNSCRYCEAAHTGALEAMGVPQEIIASSVDDPEMRDLSTPQRVVLKFALKVARTPREVNAEDYAALQQVGFSRGEIMEIIMTAALNEFINIWADASGIPLDSAP